MLAYKKTLEQEIEAEIALLTKELSLLAPLPGASPEKPSHNLNQKNVISGAFNRISAGMEIQKYMRDLPRRQNLLRQIEHYRRRLNALHIHKIHAAGFSFAA